MTSRLLDPVIWLVGALAVLTASYTVLWIWSAAASGSPSAPSALGPIPGALVTLEVAILVRQRRLLRGVDHRAGWLLVVACGLYWLSDAGSPSTPSLPGPGSLEGLVAIALLAVYPLIGFGLLSLSRARFDRGRAITFMLDQTIVGWGSAMVLWHLVLFPAARAAGTDLVAIVLAAISPSIDLALVFLAIAVAIRPMRALSPLAGWAVVLAIACVTAIDLGSSVEAVSGRDLGPVLAVLQAWFWLIGALGLTALQRPAPDEAAVREARPPSFGWLPYAVIAVAFVVPALASWNDLEMLEQHVPASLLLLFLVLARLAVTSRLHARAAAVGEAQRLETRFHSLVQHASDVVVLADVDSRVRYVTPSARGMLGADPDALVGRPLVDLLHPDDVAKGVAELADVAAMPAATQRGEFRLRRADGSFCEAEMLLSNMLDVPDVGGIVFTVRDIGERKALERELRFRALHDPLTGLANRTLFSDRVEHALARATRRRRGLAVLFIDLDDFKKVNDSHGHDIGDRLLVEAAARVANVLRSGDTAARLGGDEFAVLLEDVRDADTPSGVAERIADEMRRPFVLDGGLETYLSASIGIAVGGFGSQGHTDLLRNADLAMYVAKSRGKHRAEVFRPSMHEDVRRRLQLEADMRHGIERGEFEVHYQPVWLTSSRRVVGVEALVRWRHPRLGLIGPSDFIDLAEETGLIVPIGAFVLHAACAQAAAWDRSGGGAAGLALAVNLSPRQLRDGGIVALVAQELGESGLPAHRLNLEITESILVDENPAIAELLARLKALGVRMSIDDFGTGYSSLSYLRRLPIDTLKIAKPFVDVITHGAKDEALAQAVVSLARSLELEVVAEGVELEDQLVALREMGCDLGQGYLVGRPVPAAALAAMAGDGRSATAA